MKLDCLDTFQMYLAVRTHFKTEEYDFFEYRGKLNAKSCSFEQLIQKPYYGSMQKLSRMYDSKELCDYFVSNMLISNGTHTFDVDAEGKRVYTDYIRRKESRTYIFKQDINRVCMEIEKINKYDFWDSLNIIEGQHPLLLRMFVGAYLAPESMCILYHVRDYISEWDKLVQDTIVYPSIVMKIKKLSAFVRIKDVNAYQSYIDEANDNIRP